MDNFCNTNKIGQPLLLIIETQVTEVFFFFEYFEVLFGLNYLSHKNQ